MTEYLRGGSLAQFLRDAPPGRLPLAVRADLALGAANGMAYLHALRVVHFDLKPDNLLLDAPGRADQAQSPQALGLDPLGRPAAAARFRAAGGGDPLHRDDDDDDDGAHGANGGGAHLGDGGGGGRADDPDAGAGAVVVAALDPALEGPCPPLSSLCASPGSIKVADFGLSRHKAQRGAFVASCRDLRGTLPYLAPELVADPERVSEKADVWSLGIVMWELLARRPPHAGLAPRAILLGLAAGALAPGLPAWCEPEWRGVVEAALDPRPEGRPSMRELAAQLEAIRDQEAAAAAALLVAAPSPPPPGGAGGARA